MLWELLAMHKHYICKQMPMIVSILTIWTWKHFIFLFAFIDMNIQILVGIIWKLIV